VHVIMHDLDVNVCMERMHLIRSFWLFALHPVKCSSVATVVDQPQNYSRILKLICSSHKIWDLLIQIHIYLYHRFYLLYRKRLLRSGNSATEEIPHIIWYLEFRITRFFATGRYQQLDESSPHSYSIEGP